MMVLHQGQGILLGSAIPATGAWRRYHPLSLYPLATTGDTSYNGWWHLSVCHQLNENSIMGEFHHPTRCSLFPTPQEITSSASIARIKHHGPRRTVTGDQQFPLLL